MPTILLRQDLVTLVNQLEEIPFYRSAELKALRPVHRFGRERCDREAAGSTGSRRSMMKLRTASGTGRPQPWRPRARGEGAAAAVACASAMPLIVLGLAVAADYVNVARFTTGVQRAADAAAAAVSGTIARNPNVDGRDVDQIAERIAAFVFARNAPRDAGGTPTVATTSRASVVTTTVGYHGVAPSNFGAALGYGAISVNASATSLGLVADSRATPAP